MILIINVLTYLIGLSWLAFGVLGIIDPEIFTESAWAALHVQITGQFGMSDIRSFIEAHRASPDAEVAAAADAAAKAWAEGPVQQARRSL